MKQIKMLGAILVVVCALSGTAASGAFAHEFTSSKAGVKLASTALATQVFTTAAGKVECKKVKVLSGNTVVAAEFQSAEVEYTECKAFGLAASNIKASYEFFAGETAAKPTTKPYVKILKNITIEAGFGSCVVTVPAAGNEKLQAISYKTNGTTLKKVELIPNIAGITSSGSGVGCTYASESKGTYTGNSEVEASDKTTNVEWK